MFRIWSEWYPKLLGINSEPNVQNELLLKQQAMDSLMTLETPFRSMRLPVALPFLLLVVLVPCGASAQSSPQDTLLNECFELRRDGHPTEALDRCRRALALGRSGRALAQLGITAAAASLPVDACRALTEALTDTTDNWVLTRRAQLEDARRTSCARVATTSVTANASSATHGEPQRTTTALGTRPPTETRPTNTRRILAWTAAGGAALGLSVALVAWAQRERVVSDYNSRCPEGAVLSFQQITSCIATHPIAESDRNTWNTLSTVGLIAGGALAVTSVVLFTTSSRHHPATSLACGQGPGTLGIRCALHF
jgi:hypothetical protein